MNSLTLFIYLKLFFEQIVLVQSIDLSPFNPCSIYLSMKPNLESEYKTRLLVEFSKWPVQFQAVSMKNILNKFNFTVTRRIKTHCFLIVNIFDSNADKVIFDWKFNLETTLLRRITRILVYLDPAQSNCYDEAGKAGSNSDQYSTFVAAVGKYSIAETEWYFCCPFCPTVYGAIRVTGMKHMSTINLFSVRRYWFHPYSLQGYSDSAYNENILDFCSDWTRFDPKRCPWYYVISNSVEEAMERTGLKFKPYNSSYGLQPITLISSTLSRIVDYPRLFGLTSLVLEYYHRPKLIYCEYEEKGKYQQQSDIWMRQISPLIGFIVIFSCLFFAVSTTHSETKSAEVSVRWLLGTIIGNFCKLMAIFLRQSWSNHQKLVSILLLEFASVFLILIYENSILHDLVIPRPDLVFGSINELMEANYTYLYGGRKSSEDAWIRKVYQTNRMITKYDCCDNKMLKNIFRKRRDGVKFVLNDDGTERQFLIQRLNIIVGFKYPCHAISPSESVFSSRIYFTAYLSPVGDYFVEAHNRLHSTGFRVVMNTWITFRRDLEFEILRKDTEKNDPEWKKQNEINQKQLLAGEYITISHLKTAFCWALISYVVSIFLFAFELYQSDRGRLRHFFVQFEININRQLGKIWLNAFDR